MYFMSDPQALHVTRNVIPGKLGVDLHLHRVHIPLVRHKNTCIMKKALRETQTLRAGCSKAEPKIFALPQSSFPGARDGRNLISWRWSLPLPTNQVWWGSMHAISSYRGNRLTNTHTKTRRPPPLQTRTQTGPITIHCAAKLSGHCNNCCTHDYYYYYTAR